MHTDSHSHHIRIWDFPTICTRYTGKRSPAERAILLFLFVTKRISPFATGSGTFPPCISDAQLLYFSTAYVSIHASQNLTSNNNLTMNILSQACVNMYIADNFVTHMVLHIMMCNTTQLKMRERDRYKCFEKIRPVARSERANK